MKVPSEVGFINEVIMSDERWYFTKEQLENSPSRKSGIDADKELANRQQAANFIRDMGQRLQVTQLCINTAIVYMHRFYVFHSFSHFHRNAIATAALFLAAKVEEQPRKLEHIIKVAQLCLQKGQTNTDRKSEVYQEQAQELVVNENILLQTLGFDVAIEHPHSFIIKFCHLANVNKDLSQTSYFMASNSLYLTTMCLQYKPTVVACFCIHLVCKWSNRLIPKSKDNLSWYSYIDQTVTQELLEQLTNEFLVIFDKCPSRLKKKIQNSQDSLSSQNSLSNYPFDGDARKQNANGQPSNASTSQQKLPNDNQNVPGPSRVLSNFEPKKSGSYSSNHHQSFHSPAVKPSSLSATAVNGSSGTSSHENTTVSKLPNATTIPPQARSSLSSSSSSNSNHMSVQQQQQQQQQPSQQLPQMSTSSYHAHKASSSGSVHNASNTVKPKINPAFGHLTNNLPLKELSSRQEQRKPEVKQEPGLHLVNSHHQKNSFKKDNGVHQESGRFVPSSHSEIISNVVKEVAMAKQNEKRVVKTEPEEDEKPFLMDASNNLMMASTKPSRNHSIFSPSPVGPSESYKLSPVEERIASDVPIKVEPVEPKPRSRSYRPGMADSELIPVIKKVDTVAGYEDIFRKSTILVPSTSALLSPKKEITKEKTSAVPVAAVNSVQIKNEPIEPKVEFSEYSKPTTAISQFIPNHSEDNVSHDKNESECTSHTHKKKKKHKEKDKRHDKEKRHKEKKRHKEDKHHHRKEHNRDSSTLRGPSPIKIVIAKDKLGDVTLPKPPKPPKPPEPPKPVTLKIIKINKDQMVVPSTSEESVPDFKSKISKDGSNSRKRERESDHEHSSKKFAYGGANSHNGYKEYKTG